MRISYITFALVVGFIMLIFLCWGCSKNENIVGSNQIIGSGKLVSESRVVGTFAGIQVTSFAKVVIKQDTVESLRIESDDNIIDDVVTFLNGTTLVVGLRDGSYNNVTVNLYVSMKNIKLLESIGAAEFSTVNSIQTDSLTCKITGAGNITLTGKTNYENVEIIGNGNVHNSNLASSFCSVTISGAGSVEAQVTVQLDAVIAGSGTIIYTGNPTVVHQSISGIGVIRQGS
ncbi:MAG: DUF2807 domain-containing protein [Bacteroidota bacterium]